MTVSTLSNYDHLATYFTKLPEFSIQGTTEYLVAREVPKLIRKISPLSKILDLGCGTGIATRFLKQQFPQASVIGADINSAMLEQASIADPSGIYLQLDKNNSPFLPNTFDAIICSYVLHENQQLNELQTFLASIAKLLRPEGLFVAWDTNKDLFQGKWVTIEGVSPKEKEIVDGEKYKVKLLPAAAEVDGTYWSPEIVTKFAKVTGFNECKTHYPLAENDDLEWLDETKLAPYFIFEAVKS